LDTLDIRIFRELLQGYAGSPLTSDFRKSLRTVARKLQVDHVTVSRRIESLHKTGVLGGWQLFVNPHVLGVKIAKFRFDVPQSAKEGLMRKLRLVEGVVTIISHYGSSFLLILYYENENSLRKKAELVQRMSNAENFVRTEIPFPECKVPLSKTDWGILMSFRRNPTRPLKAISSDLRLSARTVKRRVGKMMEGLVMFALPSLNPKALHGATAADLTVAYTDPELKNEADKKIIARLGEYLTRAELGDREHGEFNLVLPNISMAQEILEWAKGQPEVRQVRVDLVQDRVELYDSLNELVERKFSQTQFPHTKRPLLAESAR